MNQNPAISVITESDPGMLRHQSWRQPLQAM
jgi:hypothetical protein